MTSAEQLQIHINVLRERLSLGVEETSLGQLVANVTHALIKSFENGDLVRVAETGMRLTTRLHVLNAITQGYTIEVSLAASSTKP